MSSVPAALTANSDVAIEIVERETESLRRILFFDGVCGLCNWSVNFVLLRDRKGEIQFAPLQGETARVLLTSRDVENLHSVVLWVNGQTYRKSAAVVRVLWRLGSFWKVLGTLLWLIPLPIRNFIYECVARNRYRLFGKKESCRLPTPEERARFLP